jgi:hypothetical protein
MTFRGDAGATWPYTCAASCALLDDGSTYCWGSDAPLATSTTPALMTFP